MAEFELVPGENPAIEIEKINPAELCEFAAKLCAEISAEVGSGQYRGGIYPGNISFGDDDEINIGPAKREDWAEQELKFIAPELYWHGQAMPSADVYSIGMLLYYAISGGKLPFDGVEDGQLRRMGGKKFSAPRAAGRRLSEIIEKATSFNASDRYQSVEELRLVLESCDKNMYIDSDKGASSLFNKDENQLSEIERLMIGIIEGDDVPTDDEEPIPEQEEIPEADETAEIPEKPQVETKVDEEEEKLREELMALFTAEDEKEEPEEAVAVEEVPVEEATVEETPVEEITEQVPPKEKSSGEGIPILTVEENPELEPVVVRVPVIPAVQYSKSAERERKIAEEVKKRRRRPMMLILVCCALLVVIAIVANAIINDIAEKNKPAETLPPVLATPIITPQTALKSTYEVIIEDISWTEARDRCREMGGYLAVISDMAEYDEIVKLAEQQSATKLWIGCHREGEQLIWETGEEASYYPWGENEPSGIDVFDGGAEDYVMLCKDDRWYFNDVRNDPISVYAQWYRGKVGFICEFEGRIN